MSSPTTALPVPNQSRDHIAIALQYARDVVEERIHVCQFVKQACQRQLDDIARQCTPDFPYRWEPTRGAKVCRFIEFFKIFEGPLKGQNLTLRPDQCFLVSTIFGWLNEGGPRHGRRRFRRAYYEVPRGTGKSSLSAAIGIFLLAGEGEGGAQVVSSGTSREVAQIIFKAAQQMVRESPELAKALGLEVLAHTILARKSASVFKAIAADARHADGKNLAGNLVDELHLHRDRRLFDSLETATGKRDQSLTLITTTAGTDIAGICFEVRSFIVGILAGKQRDESSFGIIYTVPEGLNWTDPKAWQAANPGWGTTVMPEVIEQLATKAQQTPAAINNFKTKFLNVWCSADSSWMDMDHWRRGHDPELRLEDFEGEPCYIGLDLASKVDLVGKTYVFWRDITEGKDTVRHYYVFTQPYLPEVAVALGRNSQYQGWQISGFLTVTPGEVVDYSQIEADLIDDSRRFELREVAFDPFQATQLSQRLMSADIVMTEVRPNALNFSEPMKEIDALTRQGRLHHNCPILDWNVSNVVCHVDNKENVYPRKERPENKIDLVVSLIAAFARVITEDGSGGTSYYQTGNLMFV